MVYHELETFLTKIGVGYSLPAKIELAIQPQDLEVGKAPKNNYQVL